MEYKEFKQVNGEEWREKILKDLKGKEYDSLVSTDRNNIRIFPDHFNRLENDPGIPSAAWQWRQDFNCSEPSVANKQILEALKGGCNSIGIFNYDVSVLPQIMNGVHPQYISIHFGPVNNPMDLVDEFENWITGLEIKKEEVNGSFGFDPIGYAARTGSWSAMGTTERTVDLLGKTKEWPGMKPFIVRADVYHNGGATLAHELGMAIAQGHEYLATMAEAGIDLPRAYNNIGFSLGTGSDYFGEIAKFRSIRLLWEAIGKEYTDGQSLLPTTVHAFTSNTNMSVLDEHNNMLRATGETMSAVIGGADSISVGRYNELSTERDPHAERWARNIHHILREESYFNKVVDTSRGSYFIEYLTTELSRKAWKAFQEIESQGGIVAALKDGFVQSIIENDRDTFASTVKEKENILIGVNKYPNETEQRKEVIEKALPTGNDIQAIIPYRIALEAEKKEHYETH